MTVPYDYDQTNINHLREVIAEQERTIEYLHERCKVEEVENHKLRGLALILLNCAGNVDRCDDCALNGNPYDVMVRDWFACDTLYDMVKEMRLL